MGPPEAVRRLVFLYHLTAVLSGHEHPTLPPGLAVNINQMSLDYLAAQIEDVIPKLILQFKLPYSNFEGPGWHIQNLTIVGAEHPTVNARFLENKGILVTGRLPAFYVNASATLGYWVFETSGPVMGQSDNTTMEILIVMDELVEGLPKATMPNCSFTFGRPQLTFLGQGFGSYLVNMASAFVENYVEKVVGKFLNDSLCWILERSLNGSGSCEDATETTRSCRSTQKNDFTFDLTAKGIPDIRDDFAYVLIDGMVSYRGQEPPYLVGDWQYSTGDVSAKSMLNIFVSDRTLNNFFFLAQAYKMTQIDQTVSYRELPPVLQGIMAIVCGGCSVRVTANLYEPPTMQVDPDGPKLIMNGWLRATFRFFSRRVTLFLVNTKIIAAVYPYISGNYLVARAHTTTFNVEFQNTGLSRIVGIVTEELLQGIEQMVPQKLKPMVDRELEFVFRPDCGVPLLPTFCGVALTEPKLRYVKNAVVIDSQFTYDVDKLIMSYVT